MKKLILTTLALSISIMSACSTASTNGINALLGDLSSTKITKAQAIAYFDCVYAKSPNKSVQLQTAHDSWLMKVDSIKSDIDFAVIMPKEKVEEMTKSYGPTDCKF